MKKMLFAALLFLPVIAWTETPNPADYTIKVHVQSTTLLSECSSDNKGSDCGRSQHLNVLIDGKKYELERLVDGNVLRTGDYKAKLIEGKQPRVEEYTRSYEFLFSDGKTGTFAVVGESE